MPKRKDSRLTGINPRAYIGVASLAPPLLLTVDRAPTIYDYKGYNVGTLWIDRSTTPAHDVWMLVNKAPRLSTWIKLSFFGNFVLSVPCDVGTAIPNTAGELNLNGDTIIVTSGAGNTATISLSDGTVGQLLIGGGGAGPAWASLTSSGGTITITPGVNTLNIDATGVILRIDTDSGFAVPAAGIIRILGGSNIGTTGATNVVTVNLDNDVILSGYLDAANYVEAGNLRMTANTLSSQNTDGDINIIPDGTGSIVMNNGAADTFIMRSTGERTMPLQPAFSAMNTILRSNVTGDGTTYQIIFDTEIFDQSGDYDHTTGIFTAPVTGKYAFSFGFSLSGVGAANTQAEYILVTVPPPVWGSQVVHINTFNMTDGVTGICTPFYGPFFTELTAADTAYITIRIQGGAKIIDVVGSNTFFMGWLVV